MSNNLLTASPQPLSINTSYANTIPRQTLSQCVKKFMKLLLALRGCHRRKVLSRILYSRTRRSFWQRRLLSVSAAFLYRAAHANRRSKAVSEIPRRHTSNIPPAAHPSQTARFALYSWPPPLVNLWAGKDSNLRRHSRQIYSLLRLTASLPAQNTCKNSFG